MKPVEASGPQQIGNYRILAELGRGGMGRVLLGSGLDGRLVAVKLVDEQFVTDDRFRARFRSEVRASRKVAGAYTASVIDANTEAPEPWLASVYVPGPPLRDVVEAAGPLAVEPALRLAAGLAASLIEVHRAKLIHRDLKPSNVLLTDDGLRVIDFGIARAAEIEDGTRFTRTGALVGTPGFMSPEQALGHDLTTASDVFSLGSVLVYACTGRGPFHGKGTPETLHKVVQAEPDLGTLPHPLRDVVSACLAKDPAARPRPERLLATIDEVAPAARPWPPAVHELIARQDAEVARLLHTPPAGIPTAVDATGVPGPGPARKGPDRRRLLAGGGAVLGVAAIAGIAAWTLRDDDRPAAGRARASSSPAVILAGHTGDVHHVVFSPDGQLLATASQDGTVRLWDIASRQVSGEPIRVAAKAAVKAVFDRVGKVLATATTDEGVKLWDVGTRRQIGGTLNVRLYDFIASPGPVSDVGYSPDGHVLAAAGAKVLQMWDADSRKPTGRLDFDGPNLLARVAFSGDGRTLAVPDDQQIRLWDVASRKATGQALLGHTGPISHAVVSPDGRTLATGSWDTTVRLWDIITRAPIGQPLIGHSHVIQGLAFTPDGRTLASASADSTARLWNVATHQPIGKPIVGHTDGVTSVAFSPDGQALATAGDRTAWLWNVADRIHS